MPFDADADQKLISLQSAWDDLSLETIDKAELTSKQWAAILRRDRKQPIIVGRFKQDVQDLIEFMSVCVPEGSLGEAYDHLFMQDLKNQIKKDIFSIDECPFGNREFSIIELEYGFYNKGARTRHLHSDRSNQKDLSLYVTRFGQFPIEYLDYEVLSSETSDCSELLQAARIKPKDPKIIDGPEESRRKLKTMGILKEINLGDVALMGCQEIVRGVEMPAGSEHCSAYVPPSKSQSGSHNHSAFLRTYIRSSLWPRAEPTF